MSNEKINFKVREQYLKSKAYRNLLLEVFGVKEHCYSHDLDLCITCKPKQFAKFIVLRHTKYAIKNSIADLDMKLIGTSNVSSNIIDVTRGNK